MTGRIYRAQAPGRQQGAVLPPKPFQRNAIDAVRSASRSGSRPCRRRILTPAAFVIYKTGESLPLTAAVP
jgi:hypothetical protein